jgi:hypothetical protein
MQDTGGNYLNHVNPNVHSIGPGEAMHRHCKRLKLGSGQAYDRLVDLTAISE